MPIKQKTPMRTVQNCLSEQIERRIKVLIDIIYYTGESGLRVARLNGSYTDRTGNLRSSIGYVIVRDGRVIDTVIYESDRGTDKSTGVKQGADFLKELAGKYNNNVELIVGAGMEYSGYVSDKGYDVLDSSEAEVKRLFLRLLKEKGFIVND